MMVDTTRSTSASMASNTAKTWWIHFSADYSSKEALRWKIATLDSLCPGATKNNQPIMIHLFFWPDSRFLHLGALSHYFFILLFLVIRYVRTQLTFHVQFMRYNYTNHENG